ncbi:MAG: hypothetical protein U0586_01030 [Candidatus Brocadiaceae bacterium]
MGIDKLCLTSYEIVKADYLREFWKVTEDLQRLRLYKYFCEMDYAQVMWRPHKFSDETNMRIPYSKIDVNPKYFDCFKFLYDYVSNVFNSQPDLERLNVSRIDLTVDIENLPMDVVFSRLHVPGFNRDSLSLYKGTVYIGSNPKIRIYDKTKEIKQRLRKKMNITDWEKGVIESEKQITRFEIQLSNFGGNLKDVVNDPVSLVSNFDRIRFYDFEDKEKIGSMVGGLYFLMTKINRKLRGTLDKFRSQELETMIKENYIASVKKWFEVKSNPGIEEVPF